MRYEITAKNSSIVLGVFEASDEQAARDMCARDAGYESEAQMAETLERPSDLVATRVGR